VIEFGREVCGRLAVAESREWLCANGVGGFASGTVAGLLTRRYHGLLVAALKPPVGRVLVAAKLDEVVEYGGAGYALAANRWADGTVAPDGYRHIERFSLDGTTPVWTFACGDALLEKRVWMEPGANTTYVRYRLLRGAEPMRLTVKALVNYRDFHALSRGCGWRMAVAPVTNGLRVTAFDGARPILLLARDAKAEPADEWHVGFRLTREEERGLDWADDNLHAATFRAAVSPGDSVTIVVSVEPEPSLDGEAAWQRRRRHEAALLAAWQRAQPLAARAPAWITQLVLAADQFIVRRPLEDDPGAMSMIAGYPWFGDWGRDTMISLPGLALVTGRPEVARRILSTFAQLVDRGMLPNAFPESGEEPGYNTADAGLWYLEAVRAYRAATRDDALVQAVFPVLAEMIRWHADGTRYGITLDRADGLLRAGEDGAAVTWMDATVGGRAVTPRVGKAVEINALWYNALRVMEALAEIAGKPAGEWRDMAARTARGFARFWNDDAGCCYDVLDGPAGHEAAVRPNQLFAVSLPASPLPPDQQRRVVDVCARQLLTSFGLRSLAPSDPAYRGRYGRAPAERDGAYHQGTAWGWLLGPFALAHLRVYDDPEAALRFLGPMAHQVADYGVGSIAEIFDGDPPFEPRGCVAQAWSVAETLRAWCEISGARRPARG